jgi:fucose 4-O-acetylase-like acetyltransferase
MAVELRAAAANRAPASGAAANRGARMLFVDNVRWTMVVLVLSMHAADTYSPFGNWYYTERPSIGPGAKLFFLTYQSALQAFFMALLFFIAGYFTPTSYDRKGAGGYLRGRLYRLGLPTLLYVALIGPVTEFYIAHSWRTTHSFAHEMGLYVVRARFLSGTGPMWFCAALLIFSCGYALYRVAVPRVRARRVQVSPAGVSLVLAALTLTTFAVRIGMPAGRSLLNMQLPDFPSYIIMFGLGVSACRAGWLQQVQDRFAATVAGLCVGLAALMWPPLLILGGATRGGFANYSGGLHWQSFALCLWEALICVGMAFGLLAVFRRYLAAQGALARFMSRHAFAVYVIHPPVLICTALLIAGWPLSAIPKFAVLWALSALLCFGIAAPLARRLPLIGQILA